MTRWRSRSKLRCNPARLDSDRRYGGPTRLQPFGSPAAAAVIDPDRPYALPTSGRSDRGKPTLQHSNRRCEGNFMALSHPTALNQIDQHIGVFGQQRAFIGQLAQSDRLDR